MATSLLAQCSNTLWCHLRSLPLWAFVLVVLLFGALRQRILPSSSSSSSPTRRRRQQPAPGVADKKTSAS
ncbi:hypothetical protein CORC01_07205 [Colletotrichum orchidophilum]|uniref:Uncharacterized protein n=1 Tax=Colletotrichum orchidophilum TaxID=1209926 RepID=A0A1G4B805_9PEZI|nr:uncharacterized protein CORC01_07205 [Colletotrichum orchidophilum]OHE97590.1 hypothetical protein CORC01_07205 [Colletotrichum orchidophilum]